MSQPNQTNPETSSPEPFLPCDRLDVYRLALEFRQSLVILDTVRNISALRDQIYRASDSIVLNIAEGAGRHARADKRRHYNYALGSASECGAALALLYACGALRAEAYAIRRAMIIRVIQMLSRLCGPPQ
jgi:four helix bundle protein